MNQRIKCSRVEKYRAKSQRYKRRCALHTAAAVLDFIAKFLSKVRLEQSKGSQGASSHQYRNRDQRDDDDDKGDDENKDEGSNSAGKNTEHMRSKVRVLTADLD